MQVSHAKPTLPTDVSKAYRHEKVIKSSLCATPANVLPLYKTPSSSSSSVVPASMGLPANLPISLSVIKKPEKIDRKRSSDDDVIIIE